MRPASILSGIAFRSALLILVVLAIVLGVAGFAILKTTQASMSQQLRSSITEDFDLLRDANETGGQTELVKFIEAAVATRSDRQSAFGLFKLSGRRIAGNISSAPAFRGWGSLPVDASQGSDDRFLGYAEKLDDNIVVAAHAQRFLATESGVILNALLLAGLVICASALTVGYVMSRTVSSKLEIIDRTLAEVAQGNAEARLPVGRSNDQIDHVSGQINAHLDRLGELMASMRNTIVAIAHDLKSPLNRAYMLLQDAAGEDAPVSTTLRRALAEMETLGGVLDTVLRISRIETSDDNSSFAPFSAALLLRDLAQTFEPVLEATGQHLRWDAIPADGAILFGDRRMVQQMLVNLIENASRHAGNGAQIELTVRCDSGLTTILVADNGPGIPAEQRETVFQPFRRLNVSRGSAGAGLGLALVKAIASRHHARVSLDDNHPGLRVAVAFPASRILPAERRPGSNFVPSSTDPVGALGK